MLERLEQPLELLTGGARDLPARQRTLRATLDWSYELLEPAEQDAVRARSPSSRGGCTLEAAEAVSRTASTCSTVGVARRREPRSAASTDRPRFAMLETIREYAAARLRERERRRMPAAALPPTS